MPTFAYTLFLEGLIPMVTAAMIFVTMLRRGKNKPLLALAWLLFFSGFFSFGLSLPSLFVGLIPGFTVTLAFITFVSLACHASLYVGVAGYCATQVGFLKGSKLAKIVIGVGLLLAALLVFVQVTGPAIDSKLGTKKQAETAVIHDEAQEKAEQEAAAPAAQTASPTPGTLTFRLEAVESAIAKKLVLGYLILAFLFVTGIFAYQAWIFRKEKVVLVYTSIMSVGIAILMLTWILREIIESSAPHLGIDILSFVSLGVIVAGVIYQTSLAMSPGIVFDSRTNKPIPFATVRIFRASDNKLLETRITAKDGRYGLMPEPGMYYLDVVASGYMFPSSTHAGYRKEIMDIKKPTMLGLEIPMDPLGMGKKT